MINNNNNRGGIWQWQQRKHHQVKNVLRIIFFVCSIQQSKNLIIISYYNCIPKVKKRMYNIKLNSAHVAFVFFLFFVLRIISFSCVIVFYLLHSILIFLEFSFFLFYYMCLSLYF